MTHRMLTAAHANDRRAMPWQSLRVPNFRETSAGRWSIRWMAPLPQWRYFDDELKTAGQYTLLKENESWMSTAPVEVEGQAYQVAAARGHVVVMGAGMGIALFNVLPKPSVTRVTLVERAPDVIALLRQAADLDNWAGIEKLKIEIGDAFEFNPRARVDYLYVDIWAKPAERNALADVQAIQRQVCASAVSWWTQEFFFLNWLEQKYPGAASTLELYREWAREIELPVIGQNDRAYIERIARLAQGAFYRDVLLSR